MSLRRLTLAVKGLPNSSRLTKKLHEGKADWSQSEHFQADQVDLLNRLVWLNYMIAMANGIKKNDLKDAPEPMPRPGGVEEEEPVFRIASQEETNKIFGG